MAVCCMMAKAPLPGRVKTRLCPPLRGDQAARLAKGFLLDTWAAARHAFGGQVVLSFAGDLADFPEELIRSASPGAIQTTPQRTGDLGARIESALEAALSMDTSPSPAAIVIGSDLPLVPPDYLTQAASLLETFDACLGPSADGGYYLIGAKRWQPGLLSGLPWSAENTMEATRARLTERGYAVGMAPPFDDIDEPDDLERLRSELALTASAPTRGVFTRVALASIE